MGECVYYIKAQFPVGVRMKPVFEKVEKFWKEGQSCYMTWQKMRDGEGRKNWFLRFRKKYPLVADYIEYMGKHDKDPDALSGLLDFGNVDDELRYEDDTICYASETWHMADWQPLADYLKAKFGAKRVVWDTEENGCGNCDGLQFFNYEQIVGDILKNKKLLPLLLHINDGLDELIQDEMIKNKLEGKK